MGPTLPAVRKRVGERVREAVVGVARGPGAVHGAAVAVAVPREAVRAAIVDHVHHLGVESTLANSVLLLSVSTYYCLRMSHTILLMD